MTSREPLAARMRPRTVDEVVGQEHLLGPDAPLRLALQSGRLRSIVLHGPPGCGKTSIARAMAAHTDHLFLQISAVLDGVKELRGVLQRADTACDEHHAPPWIHPAPWSRSPMGTLLIP